MGAPRPCRGQCLGSVRSAGTAQAGVGIVTTAVVVGNPKPGSRTLGAATYVAAELSGSEPELIVDLATLGSTILDWGDEHVNDLVTQVGQADLVVFASPTYKAAYTGLLKLFLDRFAGGTGLSGIAIPLMLGGSPAHSLAPELTCVQFSPRSEARCRDVVCTSSIPHTTTLPHTPNGSLRQSRSSPHC